MPAPTPGCGRQMLRSDTALHEPSTMLLSACPAIAGSRLRQKSPSTTAVSRVLAKLEESLRLHCCCGVLGSWQGWNLTVSPVVRGYGASMHMPVGAFAVSDPTTLMFRPVV